MTLYLDAVFILNILLNSMILLLVRLLVRDNTHRWRVLFGAFIATLLVPLSIYFPHSFFTTVLGKLMYSILIIFCAFRFLSFKHYFKVFALFYFITFGIGGGLIAIHYIMHQSFELSSGGILTYNTGLGDSISWLFVLIGFPIVWIFTKMRMDRHTIDQIRYDEIYPVTLKMNGITRETNGFIDSGNQLVDPITRVPVIICDEPFLMPYFTTQEWKQLRNAQEDLSLVNIPDKWKSKIFIVPYKGVEGTQDILFTIKPDLLTIDYNNQKLVTRKLLIGIQFSNLTEDRRYHCLLHPQIIHKAIIVPA